MMKLFGILCLMVGLTLTGCGHKEDAMQAPLNKIRVMIKQSASLAAQAACMDPGHRKEMVHAAAVLARRAMGGPEMAKIHKMMSMQPDTSGSGMSMKKTNGGGTSSEMKMHMDLHDAGEDVFDFLDGVDGKPGISCAQAAPASMAAAAAVLRETKSQEAPSVIKKLDQTATSMLDGKGAAKTPDPVRALTLALQRI